ncbi:MAG: SPOR domain-containing protein [Steroidobacteraceae bacterium]
MDRRVKERLLGASILVMLAVLIVPELLSGPAPQIVAPARAVWGTPQPVRNITLDLATNKASPAEPAGDTASASPQPAETRAAPAAGGAGGSELNSTGAVTEPSPSVPTTKPPRTAPSTRLETAPPAPTSAAAAPRPATAGWAVQLGSFANRANADKLMHQLRAQGFAAHVVSGGSGRALRYRVRIGPMADRGAALQTVAKLKSLGHAANTVHAAT